MKNRRYFIAALVIASVFWFFDASIHYFVYGEPQFEFIPTNANELWMRTTIILLIIMFGLYADSSARKLLTREKQLEASNIYKSMIYANHHILNNLLNQMQLFKAEALKSKDFDQEIIKYYNCAIDEATSLIQRLSEIENITHENIWASVDPDNIANSANRTHSADEKSTPLSSAARPASGKNPTGRL